MPIAENQRTKLQKISLTPKHFPQKFFAIARSYPKTHTYPFIDRKFCSKCIYTNVYMENSAKMFVFPCINW